MNPALTVEVRQKVANEIMEVLKKNNLPVPKGIKDAVTSLMKEVSCHHQWAGVPK